MGKHEPKVPSPFAVKKLREFLENVEVLPSGDQTEVQERMTELREMGLEDIPEYKGFSSSMRQYAWSSLGIEKKIAAGEIKDTDEYDRFITFDKALLALKDKLAARFKLMPTHPEEMEILLEKLEQKMPKS